MAHQARTFTMDGGDRLDYLLFLPEEYESDRDRLWPFILFMHGAGERGRNTHLLLRQGLPRYIEEQRPDFPFIMVTPQCPANSSWHRLLSAVDRLVDDVLDELRADRDRLYLTGISMGGYAAWHLGVMRPDRWAAVVPICGFGVAALGFPEAVCGLKDVPVWTFHGGRDTIVPVAATRELVDELEKCGGNVRFTVYPEEGHDSWTRTYANPELYDWLLSHSRSLRRPEAP